MSAGRQQQSEARVGTPRGVSSGARIVIATIAFTTSIFGAPSAHAQDVVVVPDGQAPPATPPPYAEPPAVFPTYRLGPPYPEASPSYDAVLRPPRMVERTTSIKALFIPGIIVFAGSYSLSAAFGALSANGDYSAWSAVPLIGPWVALGYAQLDSEVAGSVFGGVAELAGLVMFVLGLTLKRTVEVPVYSVDPHDPLRAILTLRSVPMPAGGGIGLSLTHG